MPDCTYSEKIEAYHDGELDTAARAEVERHLESCGPCAALLMRIQDMSRLFADAAPVRLSQIGLARLHANLDLLTDRGLLRLARVMTGLAAAVLVCGTLWLVRTRPAAAPVTPTQLSYVLQAEEQVLASTDSGSSSNDWMVQELSY
jgi:anti-sigma factor RsiW